MSNLAELASVIIVGLIGGIAVGLQGPMSGAISAKLGPLGSSLIIHVGGAILSLVLLMFAGGVNLREVNTLPKPYLLAGVFGVILYLTLAFTLPRVGVTVSVALLILAQLVIGLLIDHFGWMGAAQHSFNATRALGVALLIAGAWLVTK
ncbi:MAG: DMT family transporter [Chloroflexota bacterium]